jgi:hypothetical protein
MLAAVTWWLQRTRGKKKKRKERGEERVIRRQHVGYKVQGKEKTSQGKRWGKK